MIDEPRFGALKGVDGTWTIFDRRIGRVVERSGLVMTGLNERAVLGLIQSLEHIEDAPKRTH